MSNNITGTQSANDTRTFRFVRVGDLRVDTIVQRALRPQQVKAIADDFNWNLLEVPTIAPDRTVIEGQQRVTALQSVDEDEVILVIEIASATTAATQAAIARGITKGRTPTRGYQDWKMRVEIGYEREVMTKRILDDRGLQMAERDEAKGHPMLLGCVTEVDRVAHWRTSEEAKTTLENILDLMMATWTERFHQQNRWNPKLFNGVAHVFMHNPGMALDLDALQSVLIRRTPDQWMWYAQEQYERGGPSYHQIITLHLVAEYNDCSAPRFARIYGGAA